MLYRSSHSLQVPAALYNLGGMWRLRTTSLLEVLFPILTGWPERRLLAFARAAVHKGSLDGNLSQCDLQCMMHIDLDLKGCKIAWPSSNPHISHNCITKTQRDVQAGRRKALNWLSQLALISGFELRLDR